MRLALFVVLVGAPSFAATIRVGPTRSITQLSAVQQNTVNAGDVVEVEAFPVLGLYKQTFAWGT